MRGANSCYLSGHLLIENVHTIPINGHAEMVVRGTIQVKPHDAQERHPVILTGQQAQVILDAARHTPDLKPWVVIEGSLFTQAHQTVVRVKFVDILNSPPSDGF
ncbi:MAG TPA: hypothetical protein PK530_24995 [Anaerolineales bacterium]|nr:hypothetical protein [Anaerolineales bacterium]